MPAGYKQPAESIARIRTYPPESDNFVGMGGPGSPEANPSDGKAADYTGGQPGSNPSDGKAAGYTSPRR